MITGKWLLGFFLAFLLATPTFAETLLPDNLGQNPSAPASLKEAAAPDTKPQGLKEGKATAYDSSLIDETAQRLEFSKQIENLVKAEKFNELDSIAEDLRKTNPRWVGGYKKLATFYEAVRKWQAHSDNEGQKHLELLQRWVKAKPNSLTARIALAKGYLDYAWFARGGDLAKNVTQKGWKLFKERLAKARQVLEEAEKMPIKDPELYNDFLMLALGEGWDREEMEDVFKKGVAIDPTYSPLYVSKAWYLQPRWYGEEGEWAKFAEETVEMTKETEGTSFYARIVWGIIGGQEGTLEFNLDEGIFTRSGLTWPKLKQGFEDMDRLYPGSLRTANAFCWGAYLAEDWETAQKLLTRIGDRLDKGIWPRFYLDRGNVYLDNRDYDKAISDLTKAIKLDPNFAWPYLSRGSIHLHYKEYDKGISDYTKAIEVDPTYKEAYIARGDAYARGDTPEENKEYDKAISDYSQVIKIDPTYKKAYIARGAIYSNNKEYDKAILDFTEAIRIDPDYALAYSSRGLSYFKKGNYDKAWEDAQKAGSLGNEFSPKFLADIQSHLKK